MREMPKMTVQTFKGAIEERLEALIPEMALPYQAVFSAARYSLLGGGKRIRPLLTLITADLFQGPCEAALDAALDAACALEMVHTYSLIHDDLPSMDNDDMRRGKPSLHRAFPESHAILAGDFLLTASFEVLANIPHLSPTQKLALIRLLSQNSGAHGMIGGQVMDIESFGQEGDLSTLTLTHQLKTGALIATAVEFGGIVADVSEETLYHLREFGLNVGLAFQIFDDILEETSPELTSDKSNNKQNYVTLMGMERAREKAEHLCQLAKSRLAPLPLKGAPLSRFIDEMFDIKP